MMSPLIPVCDLSNAAALSSSGKMATGIALNSFFADDDVSVEGIRIANLDEVFANIMYGGGAL